MLEGMNETSLQSTRLLDTGSSALTSLVEERRWRDLPERERIGAIYEFVRDEIRFGYNRSDDVIASEVLRDGYGQCNTKSTLLMALLRVSGIACRFHGFTIHKRLQKGVVTGLLYWLAPREILHSWVEVQVDGQWVPLEGVILDDAYLDGVRRFTGVSRGPLLGYAVGTEDVSRPEVQWKGEPTFIQRTGIARDLGLFDDPDAFYAQQGTNLGGVRRWLFENVFRHQMNRRVNKLRTGGEATSCSPAARSPDPAGLATVAGRQGS
jgi:hypothetical protein